LNNLSINLNLSSMVPEFNQIPNILVHST
jgi:hypothetical protein